MTQLSPGIIARIATGDPAAYRVAADWLLERGDTRGEVILAELDAHANPVTRHAARRRRLELEPHYAAWKAPVLKLGVTSCDFRHGFIERVALPERALGQLQALLDLEPISGLHVTVTDGQHLRAAMRTPAFARIRTLELLGGQAVLDVSAPGLKGLLVRPLVAAHIPRVPALFPALETLGVSFTTTGEAAVSALASGVLRVKHLWAARAGVTDRSLLSLIERGSAVEALDLSFNELTPRALQLLGAARTLPALRELSLMGCRKANDFLSPRGLPRLRRLRLRSPASADRAVFDARGISLW
jgi:hypothetical protein